MWLRELTHLHKLQPVELTSAVQCAKLQQSSSLTRSYSKALTCFALDAAPGGESTTPCSFRREPARDKL